MKEIILIGADYCPSCKIMHEWFFTIEIPGITFRYKYTDDPDCENVSSLPTIIFKDNGQEVQRITGAISKADLIRNINSIFGGE